VKGKQVKEGSMEGLKNYQMYAIHGGFIQLFA
jgi:hypothetical protein